MATACKREKFWLDVRKEFFLTQLDKALVKALSKLTSLKVEESVGQETSKLNSVIFVLSAS